MIDFVPSRVAPSSAVGVSAFAPADALVGELRWVDPGVATPMASPGVGGLVVPLVALGVDADVGPDSITFVCQPLTCV